MVFSCPHFTWPCALATRSVFQCSKEGVFLCEAQHSPGSGSGCDGARGDVVELLVEVIGSPPVWKEGEDGSGFEEVAHLLKPRNGRRQGLLALLLLNLPGCGEERPQLSVQELAHLAAFLPEHYQAVAIEAEFREAVVAYPGAVSEPA